MKKPSKEFLQQFNDKWSFEGLAESTRAHIGKLVDSGKIPDLIVDAGCAYFGVKAAQRILDLRGLQATPEQLFAGAVIGLLGKRLALAEGGTPAVSQIAGLTILASIGLIDSVPSLAELLGISAKALEAVGINQKSLEIIGAVRAASGQPPLGRTIFG